MKVVIIVQARMTSTRLPGKILKEVAGKPLLEYQVERLKRVHLADDLVIATTINNTDNPVVALCEKLQVNFFRGSESDVLARYHGAAVQHNADAIVRVTSDCPLIDPAIIDKVIQTYRENHELYDYVSNTLERTYPRGMDTEVFSRKALDTAYKQAVVPCDREHVTPFIIANNSTKRKNISHYEDQSRHRWTVDTYEDFELIKNILEKMYPAQQKFTMQDVLNCLQEYSAWVLINAHVEQKHV